MARDVVFELKLVGGPYDGTRGLQWRASLDFPLPEFVEVGWCAGDGRCTSSERECRQLGHGKRHVAYWIEGEETTPDDATAYELFRDYVIEGGQYGVAEYTIPGLQLPKGETMADKLAMAA